MGPLFLELNMSENLQLVSVIANAVVGSFFVWMMICVKKKSDVIKDQQQQITDMHNDYISLSMEKDYQSEEVNKWRRQIQSITYRLETAENKAESLKLHLERYKKHLEETKEKLETTQSNYAKTIDNNEKAVESLVMVAASISDVESKLKSAKRSLTDASAIHRNETFKVSEVEIPGTTKNGDHKILDVHGVLYEFQLTSENQSASLPKGIIKCDRPTIKSTRSNLPLYAAANHVLMLRWYEPHELPDGACWITVDWYDNKYRQIINKYAGHDGVFQDLTEKLCSLHDRNSKHTYILPNDLERSALPVIEGKYNCFMTFSPNSGFQGYAKNSTEIPRDHFWVRPRVIKEPEALSESGKIIELEQIRNLTKKVYLMDTEEINNEFVEALDGGTRFGLKKGKGLCIVNKPEIKVKGSSSLFLGWNDAAGVIRRKEIHDNEKMKWIGIDIDSAYSD